MLSVFLLICPANDLSSRGRKEAALTQENASSFFFFSPLLGPINVQYVPMVNFDLYKRLDRSFFKFIF